MITRRHFITATALGAAACAIPVSLRAGEPHGDNTFAVFTKHLVGLDADQLGTRLEEIGVDAIEAPIRPQGHVEPERVKDDLPAFVGALKKHGVKVAILASGINAVDPKQNTESVLRTAKSQGITRYRMDWYEYDPKKPVWDQLNEIKAKLKDLVALSKEIGILPCYQNHSGGKYVGGLVWDMAMLMRDYKPTELAWGFDIMHATAEAAISWPTLVNVASSQLGVLYFKNFKWDGKRRIPVPLAEGVIDRKCVEKFKEKNFAGPICIHIEYLSGTVKNPDYLRDAISATRRDYSTLKAWWS